jgi:hypothetical protein
MDLELSFLENKKINLNTISPKITEKDQRI